MANAAILLVAILFIGLLLWIIKSVMKFTFSIAKLLMVLFVVWFAFAAFTGGVGQAIDGIGEVTLSEENGTYTSNAFFSSGEIDLSTLAQAEGNIELEINGAAADITLKLPDDYVAIVNFKGAALQADLPEESKFILVSKENIVTGSGHGLIQVRLNAAFCKLRVEE